MPPPTPILNPRNPLHLYRHLLREATYLPPLAQPFFTNRIRTDFRRKRPESQLRWRLRQAASYARYLYAANAGNLVRMRHLLELALGRNGKRRRELMADLERKEPVRNTNELLAVLNAGPTLEEEMLMLDQEKEEIVGSTEMEKSKGRKRDWLDNWDTKKLLAFAHSQSTKTLQGIARLHTQRLKPEDAVPKFNTWGRPFAAKTARSKTRKWWKMLAHRIVPPLPQGEWDILAKLASGTAGPEWDTPVRRHAVAGADAVPTYGYGFGDAVMKPVRMLERPNARNFRVAMGTESGAEATEPYHRAAIGIHTYTPRLWRRLYMSLWRTTAVMHSRDDKPGWKVTWGGGQPAKVSTASAVHEGFFRNAEAIKMKEKSGRRSGEKKGRVPKAPLTLAERIAAV